MGMSSLARTQPYHFGLPSQQAHVCRAQCVFRRSENVNPIAGVKGLRRQFQQHLRECPHGEALQRPSTAGPALGLQLPGRGRPSSASPHEPLPQRQRPAERLGVCLRTTIFANAGPGLASALGRGRPSLQAWWPCASRRGVTVAAQQARDVPLPIPRQQGCQTPHNRSPAITSSRPRAGGPNSPSARRVPVGIRQDHHQARRVLPGRIPRA